VYVIAHANGFSVLINACYIIAAHTISTLMSVCYNVVFHLWLISFSLTQRNHAQKSHPGRIWLWPKLLVINNLAPKQDCAFSMTGKSLFVFCTLHFQQDVLILQKQLINPEAQKNCSGPTNYNKCNHEII